MEPIGCCQTSVNTNLHCVTSLKSDDLIYTAAETWNHRSLIHLCIYLFIGNLFTDAVSNSDWMPSSNWWRCVTNCKGCGRRQLWPYFRYIHPFICLERLKKTTQNSQDSGVLVGIRSGYMPNASQMCILFEPSCSATVFEKPTGPQVVKKKSLLFM